MTANDFQFEIYIKNGFRKDNLLAVNSVLGLIKGIQEYYKARFNFAAVQDYIEYEAITSAIGNCWKFVSAIADCEGIHLTDIVYNAQANNDYCKPINQTLADIAGFYNDAMNEKKPNEYYIAGLLENVAKYLIDIENIRFGEEKIAIPCMEDIWNYVLTGELDLENMIV